MMWKRTMIQVVWWLAGTATITLLVAAMQKKSTGHFNALQIEIMGAAGHVFADETDIQQILREKGVESGKAMNAVNLRAVEEALEKDPWIFNAELFFDNRNILQVRITEREPLARIFTITGGSFYLDTTGKVLPLSDKLSARVPLFTGVPFSERLSASDSSLLKDVLRLSRFIVADSFWSAQVAQVNVSGNRFEIVPVIGNHTILFGDGTDIEAKFRKLYAFYRNVSAKAGFDIYESINLEYEGQVVATRRGAAVPVQDSVMAMQQLRQTLGTSPPAVVDSLGVKTEGSTGKVNRLTPKAVMPRMK
ncbi:MAG TPA: FtsQ-type POTRA domain-containing protein [Chitinophagaceae bacterium]